VIDVDHRKILTGLAEVIRDHDWDRLGDFMHADAVMEYPQSGERFSGLANIRGQFENYPNLEPGGTELDEVVGGTSYGMTRMYTLVALEGSGTRGTAVMRAHYPDGSLWWVVNMYELRGDKISRTRNFFGPQFDPPEWRVPYGDTG
jgi:hypothetical protein